MFYVIELVKKCQSKCNTEKLNVQQPEEEQLLPIAPKQKLSVMSRDVLPEASNDLQVPSGLSMPSFMNCTEVFGLRSRFTPPTKAASQWPCRMAWKAFSRASRLEEHAVSMAVLGPGEQRQQG